MNLLYGFFARVGSSSNPFYCANTSAFLKVHPFPIFGISIARSSSFSSSSKSA